MIPSLALARHGSLASDLSSTTLPSYLSDQIHLKSLYIPASKTCGSCPIGTLSAHPDGWSQANLGLEEQAPSFRNSHMSLVTGRHDFRARETRLHPLSEIVGFQRKYTAFSAWGKLGSAATGCGRTKGGNSISTERNVTKVNKIVAAALHLHC